MKIAIVLNAARVTEDLANTLKSGELANEFDIQYDYFIKGPKEITAFVKTLNPESYNAFLVGGGDGTVRAAAEHLKGHQVPLAILPLGTFNLLAKSLEYPNDIRELFAIIKNGKTKFIDMAEVNGNIIINHSWIGIYYNLLKSRKRYKHWLGTSRVFKGIFNICNAFRTFPTYTVELTANNQQVIYNTCLIFIGNNESETNIFNFGEHKYLSSGLLSVQIANCQSRWHLFLFMVDVLFKGGKNSKYVTSFTTDHLLIKAQSSMVNMVIDGELVQTQNPLHFKIHPKELMVLHP